MRALLKLSHLIDVFVTRVGQVAAWAGVALIAVTVFDVVTRRFFVLGSTKLQDGEWWLHTVLFSLCLGFAYLKDAHVRIDLIRDGLGSKAKHLVELLGIVLFLLPYSILVIWFSFDFFERSFMLDEGSKSATGLNNVWIIKTMIPIGFSLLFLSGLCVLMRKIVDLFGPPDLRAEAEAEEEAERVHLIRPEQS